MNFRFKWNFIGSPHRNKTKYSKGKDRLIQKSNYPNKLYSCALLLSFTASEIFTNLPATSRWAFSLLSTYCCSKSHRGISPGRNAHQKNIKNLPSLKAGEFFLLYSLYSAVTRIFLVLPIVMARNSWNLFSPSAIANCFRRAYFITPSTHFEEVVESGSISSFESDFYALLRSIREMIAKYSAALCRKVQTM